MNHLPFTITAYLLNGVAVTVDKFLISKHIPDPLIYVFYFSIVSLLALFILPFTHIPNLNVLILASLSTLLWTTGAYFMFKGLQIGQVSRVIPVIGTLTPLILLFVASFTTDITKNQSLAVFILLFGLIFLTAHDWKGKFELKELQFEVLSSVFFSVSYLILRQAYLMDDFLTVFAWSRPILIPVGLILLIIPYTRKIVLNSEGPKIPFFSKAGLLFISGQVSGGISELLLTFSVSLANPALVNSLQGVQYVFLFLLSLGLSKKYPEVFSEQLTTFKIVGKVFGIILIAAGLYLLAFS